MSNWIKRVTEKSIQKRLAVAITAGLLAGVYAPMGIASVAEAAAAAPVQDQPIKVEAGQNETYDNVKISTEGEGNAAVVNDGTAYIGSGKIYTKDGYAIKNNGTLNLNASVSPEGTVIGTKHKLNIDGNIYQGAKGTTNIVLDTYASKLHGVVSNSEGGTVNMVLSDSGEWVNEGDWKTSKKVGHVSKDGQGYEYTTVVTEVKLNDPNFKGSHINNLVAGNGGKHAYDRGSIIQKDNNPLRIDNLSGNLIVHYDRKTGIGTEGSHYIGGDTIIGHAAEGTVITISTPKLPGDKNVDNFIDFGPNADIYVDDFTISKILDTLAGKLVYEGATKGETNLAAKVQIGSGMTASSSSTWIKDITFDETGRGNYEYTVPYNFTAAISGDKTADTQYDAAGVIQADGTYLFDGKSDVNITASDGIIPWKSFTLDTQGKNLNMNVRGAGFFDDFDVDMAHGNDSHVVINANAVNMNVNGSGNIGGIDINEPYYRSDVTVNVKEGLHLKVHSAGEGSQTASTVFGIRANGPSEVTVNGDVSLKERGNNWGLTLAAAQSRNYYHIAGLYAENNGRINVNGNVDMAVQGSGIVTYGEGAEVNVKGGTILIDRDLISHIESGQFGQQTKHYAHMYSLVARGGNINMNMNEQLDGAADNTVELNGNIGVIQGRKTMEGIINLGLSNAESSLTGVVYNTGNKKATERTSAFNLYLSNGATWTNEDFGHVNTEQSGSEFGGYIPGFTGSYVNKLAGGATEDKAGFIKQMDGRDITIDNYSGYSTLYYQHTGNGTDAAHYAAGNTIINKAAVGSGITVLTDNNGIDMTNISEVNNVLNTLAGKLFYKGYIAGATQEKNLSGKVQIASGMTASAVAKDVADIIFSEETGQGSIDMNAVPPTPTGKTEFTTQITGMNSDKEYVNEAILQNGKYTFDKNANITVADKAAIDAQKSLVIDAGKNTLSMAVTGSDKKDALGIYNFGKGVTADITANKVAINVTGTDSKAVGIKAENKGKETENVINIKGDVAINATGTEKAVGMQATGNAEINVNGNVSMRDGKDGWGVENPNGHRPFFDVYGILAYTDFAGSAWKPGEVAKPELSSGGEININGNVDLAVKGTAVCASGAGSEVNINGGGTILVDQTNKDPNYAILASSGSVNMNMNATKDAAAENKVNISGNIAVTDTMSHSQEPEKDATINLGLSTKDSTLHGVVVNSFSKANQDKGFGGEVNLYMSNGATWTNEAFGAVDKKFENSSVSKFVGGKDEASAGAVVQKDSGKIDIKDFSGHAKFFYEHKGDATTADAFAHLGDTVIGKAAAGSSITMLTQKGDINMKDAAVIDKVLNNLASKLVYSNAAADKNLTGKVGIASGLTSSSASLQVGDIAFGTDNKGGLVAGSVKPGTSEEGGQGGQGGHEQGDYETYMMSGARAAMTDSMLTLRELAADGFNRTSELRGGVEAGAWANIYGGESKFAGETTNFSNSYKAVQAGFDKVAGDWTMGMAFDYRDSESDYVMGGEGEGEAYTVGVYGSKDMGNGAYLDLSAKAGKVENQYKVYNELGQRLDGEFSAPGYSVSAQYGKRVEKGEGYFEPQMQFTWTHVDGDEYAATCEKETMNINQEAFDSLVGRIGIEAGVATDKGSVYTRLSLNHEFAGDVEGSYVAKDGGAKQTSYDVSDTWSDITVGGSFNLSKCANFHADITKALTGDYKQDWKVNAGFSFSF